MMIPGLKVDSIRGTLPNGATVVVSRERIAPTTDLRDGAPSTLVVKGADDAMVTAFLSWLGAGCPDVAAVAPAPPPAVPVPLELVERADVAPPASPPPAEPPAPAAPVPAARRKRGPRAARPDVAPLAAGVAAGPATAHGAPAEGEGVPLALAAPADDGPGAPPDPPPAESLGPPVGVERGTGRIVPLVPEPPADTVAARPAGPPPALPPLGGELPAALEHSGEPAVDAMEPANPGKVVILGGKPVVIGSAEYRAAMADPPPPAGIPVVPLSEAAELEAPADDALDMGGVELTDADLDGRESPTTAPFGEPEYVAPSHAAAGVAVVMKVDEQALVREMVALPPNGKLRDVLALLRDAGVIEEKDMLDFCTRHQTEVPILNRIQVLSDRIPRTRDVMGLTVVEGAAGGA